MATVRIKSEGDSFDSMMKRFKRQVSNDGIVTDIKRHEVYEKPSIRRKKKAEQAKKRRS